jgi:hypothetical protein
MSRRKTIGHDISAEEFDAMFDRGESVAEYLDLSTARRPGMELQSVDFELPRHMLDKLDREARRLGVTRQALIKMWIAERLG